MTERLATIAITAVAATPFFVMPRAEAQTVMPAFAGASGKVPLRAISVATAAAIRVAPVGAVAVRAIVMRAVAVCTVGVRTMPVRTAVAATPTLSAVRTMRGAEVPVTRRVEAEPRRTAAVRTAVSLIPEVFAMAPMGHAGAGSEVTVTTPAGKAGPTSPVE